MSKIFFNATPVEMTLIETSVQTLNMYIKQYINKKNGKLENFDSCNQIINKSMYIHSSTLYSTKEYAKPQWLGLFQCHTITGIDMTRSELITTIAIEVETLYILV